MRGGRRFGTLFAIALLAGCAHAGPSSVEGDRAAPPAATDATGAYLGRLIAGDRAAIAAGFSGQPSIDDPFAGAVRGEAALDAFVGERHAWLTARAARLTRGSITRAGGRTVVEAALRLRQDGREIDLPIAVVGDDGPGGRVRALRVYHSFWPLEGAHRVRAPLLPADPNAHVTGAVADYQRALAAGDVGAIVATFEPDGYFREPSGEPWVHRGQAELRKFMAQILGAGGIGIEHATVTDDGTICAIEFNAVRFGKQPLAPQAGLAIYERGPSGRLRAARIYDDVNVEVLQQGAAASGPADFRVFAYELDLQIDREKKTFAGRETIRLRATGDRLAVVEFPTNGIRILSVTSERGHALATPDRIQIRPATALAPGQEMSVVIDYIAREPRGVSFHTDAVYTHFDTCHWMVCRDRPDDKATFTLTLAVPDGLTLIASGAPVAGQSARQQWRESVPSSPYLFGFVLGKLTRTVRTHRGVTLEYFASGVDEAAMKAMFADDDRMLDFFTDKAGRPLPRAFYRQVVVDGEAAQEVSSFSILGRAQLEQRLKDPTEDWLVAHEMAHQFWGNMVTCADWSHFWLNEGLTVFMVAAYKERRWGRPAYERELALFRARHQAAVSAKFDVPLTFAGEYPSLTIKRAIAYSKGALFLDRLRAQMGEGAFWGALAKYTRRFAGGTAVTQDFQRAFAAETPADLSPLFEEWAYGRDAGRASTTPAP